MPGPTQSPSSSPPSHRILLRWHPQPELSPVYTEVGKAWQQGDEGTLHLRLLVLDQPANLRLTRVGPSFPQDPKTAHRLVDHPPSKTLPPTHQLTIRQVLVGVAWELPHATGFNARLSVLGQVVELVMQPERGAL